ncbi:protein phosphatase [Vibrio rotiferianus]|uniref:Protein phosphatase n=1 Tax=Vibrio rotiferianus TaxID=190895 RepID=A0A510I6X2_9VIBR|nr:PP2C family serine/threonine-protein phosphatase [Vibrio rotiferianus]BBL88948.1 protein phosphatase [Vibrio rotiferianus]
MSGKSVDWRGFSDSEIGPLHVRIGLPNQDACHLEIGDESVLVALSDGVGSRALSHLGAQAVCRATVRLAQHNIVHKPIEPESLLRQFHELWLDELGEADVQQCSCTALFAIKIRDHFFIAQLGDGACCIITSDHNAHLEQGISFLSQKDDVFFANQTRALGGTFKIDDWQYCFQKVIDIEGCFLVTDGIYDDIADENRARFFLELLNYYQRLSDREVKLDVRNWISQWPVAGHSDDKTIAAFFRQHSPQRS